MIYNFFTLKKESFSIEADSDIKVSDMIQLIYEKFESYFKLDKIKIVCQGKLFSADKKMSDYQVDYNTTTLIATEVDMNRLKAIKKQPEQTKEPEKTPTSSTQLNSSISLNNSANTQLPVNNNFDSAAFTQSQLFRSLPENLQTSVKNISELGFPLVSILNALHVANFNPDLAVDILMGGDLTANEYNQQVNASFLNSASNSIQNTQSTEPASATINTINHLSTNSAVPSTTRTDPNQLFQSIDRFNAQSNGSNNRIEPTEIVDQPVPNPTHPIFSDENIIRLLQAGKVLNSTPGYPYLKEILDMTKKQPVYVLELLKSLRQADPKMFQHVLDNPRTFLKLWQTIPKNTKTPTVDVGVNMVNQQPNHSGTGTNKDNLKNDTVSFNVTQEEKDAINRLVDMGFPQDLVIQVYFACNKDENIAADILSKDFQN